MIGHASVREEKAEVGSNVNVGWWSLIKAVQKLQQKADGQCYWYNFDTAFPLKWRIIVRTKLPRTSTLLRTRVFCGISFRGEWGKRRFVSLLSLRSAVKTAVVWGAERKRVGLGSEMFAWHLVFCLNSCVRKLVLADGSSPQWNQWFVSSKVTSELWSFLEILLHCVATIYR